MRILLLGQVTGVVSLLNFSSTANGQFLKDKPPKRDDSREGSDDEDGEEKKEQHADDDGNDASQPEPELPAEDEPIQGEEGERGEEEDGEGDVLVTTSTKSKKKLINAFNYCERASLTNINTSRVISRQWGCVIGTEGVFQGADLSG